MDTGIIPSYGGPLNMHLSYHRNWLGERAVLVHYHEADFRKGNVVGVPVHVDSFDDVCVLIADVADSQGAFQLCRSRSELERAQETGAIGLFLAPSFAAAGERLERLYAYKALGATVFPASSNSRNPLADGCGERKPSGLSHLGIAAVRMLNELGIIIDVSHLSEQAFWDVSEISSQPIVASHSNSKTVCDNPRNLSDEQAKAIANKGGCIGVSVHPSLLSKGQPTVEDYVEHILHFVAVVGEDHVMMGADFVDYQIEFVLPKLRLSAELGIYHEGHVSVPGLSSFADLSTVPDLLRKRGVNEAAVEKVSMGNFLRMVEEVGAVQVSSSGGRAAQLGNRDPVAV